MMGGNANAFKILELSPFLPNARLAICRQDNTLDSNRRTAVPKRWCSIWASDLSKEKRVLALMAKISFGPCSPSSILDPHPHFFLCFTMCYQWLWGGSWAECLKCHFFWSPFPSPILHGLLWLTCACGSRRNVLKLQFSRSALCSWISGQLYDTHGL